MKVKQALSGNTTASIKFTRKYTPDETDRKKNINTLYENLQSKLDVKEAMDFGKYAIKFALNGENDKMVGIKVISNRPYKYKYIAIPLSDVANGVKELSNKYLEEENGFIKYDYLTYINKFM